MTKRRVVQILLWLAVVGWMALIFCFSAQPAVESSQQSGGLIRILAERLLPHFNQRSLEAQAQFIARFQNPIRKAAHASVYFVLGGLVLCALRSHPLRTQSQLALALLLSLCYAVSDEVHQIFVPGRACRATDVLIDLIGAVLGAVFVSGIVQISRCLCDNRGQPKRKSGKMLFD